MEIRLKKTVLVTLLGLGAVGVAHAAGFTAPAPACVNHPVTIPCDRNAWDIAFEGDWFQPTNDDLFFFQSQEEDETYYKDVLDPKYAFGFRVEGSYHFKTGNDITLNWSHFDHSTSDDRSPGGTWHHNGDAEDGNDFNSDGNANFNFNSVNLELGQHFDVGSDVAVRAHTGVSYVKIDHTLSYGNSWVDDPDDRAWIEQNSEFTGVGLRAGMDWTYNLGSGFNLVARMAGSLLVGNLTNDMTVYTHEDNRNDFDPDDICNEKVRTIVPAGDAKLGLSYTTMMSEGSLTLEGGYGIQGYFHTISHMPLGYDVFGENADARYVYDNPRVSNFGLDGAYLMLKYVS